MLFALRKHEIMIVRKNKIYFMFFFNSRDRKLFSGHSFYSVVTLFLPKCILLFNYVIIIMFYVKCIFTVFFL